MASPHLGRAIPMDPGKGSNTDLPSSPYRMLRYPTGMLPYRMLRYRYVYLRCRCVLTGCYAIALLDVLIVRLRPYRMLPYGMLRYRYRLLVLTGCSATAARGTRPKAGSSILNANRCKSGGQGG